MPTPTSSFDWHEGSGGSTASLLPGGYTLAVTDWTLHNGIGAIGPSGSVTDWTIALSITVNTLSESALLIVNNGSTFYNLNASGHVGIFPNYSTSGPVIQAGVACNVVFTVSGGTTLKAYIDGVLVGTWTGTYSFNPADTTIQTMVNSHPDAQVHSLRYWGGVALSAGQVADLLDAPRFGSIGAGISGTASTCDVPVPAGVSAGDAILALVYVGDTTTTVGVPDGTWSEAPNSPFSNAVGQAYTARVYEKRATGADTGVYSFTLSASAFRKAVAVRYTNCVETGPLLSDADSANNLDFSGPPVPTPPVEVTSDDDNSLLILITTCWSGATPTVPTGFTARGSATTSSAWSVSDEQQYDAGDSGAVSGSYSASTVALGAWLAALKPKGSGPTNQDFTASPAEHVGVTDAVALARSTGVAESVGLGDSVVLQRGTQFSESVGISDSVNASLISPPPPGHTQVLPALVPILHRVWTVNTDPVRHGQSGEGTLGDPVQRFAIQVYPMSWTNPDQDPITVDATGRTVTDLLVDVYDPATYKKNDEILIGGVSFVVQGLPGFDDVALGPLPEFDELFSGGTVHVRRVT